MLQTCEAVEVSVVVRTVVDSAVGTNSCSAASVRTSSEPEQQKLSLVHLTKIMKTSHWRPKTIQLYLPFLVLHRLLALHLYFYKIKLSMYHDIKIITVHNFYYRWLGAGFRIWNYMPSHRSNLSLFLFNLCKEKENHYRRILIKHNIFGHWLKNTRKMVT